MNLFGNSAVGDGSNSLLRNIALAGGVIILGALVGAASLDKAAKDGTLNKIAGWGVKRDMNARMANIPRSNDAPGKVIGIRYGNVDYTPTASINGQKSRFKNTFADPSLGMPN